MSTYYMIENVKLKYVYKVWHGVVVMPSSITRVTKESGSVGTAMPSMGKPGALIIVFIRQY